MSWRLSSIALLVALSACVSIPTVTEAEKVELQKAMTTPATFEMGKEESAAAWGRVQVFAWRHSRIRTASDFVLDAGRCPHFTAERLPLGEDRFRITLGVESCHHGPPTPASEEQLQQDIHVFAHFVRTGELVCAREGVSACVSPKETEFSFEPSAPHPFHTAPTHSFPPATHVGPTPLHTFP